MSDLSSSHGVKSADVNFLGEIFDDRDSESDVEICLNADLNCGMGESVCSKSDRSISADDTKYDGQTARIEQECTTLAGPSYNNTTSEVQANNPDREREREREDSSSGKGVTVRETEETTKGEQEALKQAECSNDVLAVDESQNDVRDKEIYDVISADVEHLNTDCRLESERNETVDRDLERTGNYEGGVGNENDLHHGRTEKATGVEDLSSETPVEEQERNQSLPEQQHSTRPEQRRDDQQQSTRPEQRKDDQQQSTQPQQRRDYQQQSTRPEQRRDDQQQSTRPEQRRDDQQQSTRPEQRRDDQQQSTRPQQRREDQQQSTRPEQRKDPPEREEGEKDEERLPRIKGGSEQWKHSEKRGVEESSMQPKDCQRKIIEETGEQEVSDDHTHCDQRKSQEQHENQPRKTEREDQQLEEKQLQQAEETTAKQLEETATELEDSEQQVDQPIPNGTLLTRNIDDCHQENKDANVEETSS